MKLDYQISAGSVVIAFDAIPPESIRTALKAQGYRFDGKAWHKRGVSGSAELVRWIRGELDKANAAAPSTPAPIAPPAAPVAPPAIAPKSPPVEPQSRPMFAALVSQAAQSQPIAPPAPSSAPIAPATITAEQAPPLPLSQPSAAPARRGKLRQLSLVEEMAGDLESYGFPPGEKPGNDSPRPELAELTPRAQQLAAELKALVYITRDLAADEWHLRTADSERNEHENLQRVVFPNGRYSD